MRRGFHSQGLTKAGCVLALVLSARVATAQRGTVTEGPATGAAPSASPVPGPPKISYAGGQLKIDALDATLADVLTKVALATGVIIDLPAGASSARMPVVQLGPGSAREVLASLLSDSDFDYLIQASDADPEKIQSVMVMVREKKASGPNGTDAAVRPTRSPYARAMAARSEAEEAPAADNPVPPQPDNPAPEANSPPAPTQPDQAAPAPLTQPVQPLQLDPNATRPGALTPPSDLSPQSISNQLQQMYQQRAQMIQQNGQASQPAQPAGTPGK